MRDIRGLTLMEVLLTIFFLGISASIFMICQKSSWSQTSNMNRLMSAGQIIEKQIEARRMWIAEDPVQNFATFKSTTSDTIVDNTVSPPVKVLWEINPGETPELDSIENVRKVELTACWGRGPNDTLRVQTCIARDF